MEITDAFEGNIVRLITRLDETCREVKKGAQIAGDIALVEKMVEGSEMIKRDIVFCTSLYYQ